MNKNLDLQTATASILKFAIFAACLSFAQASVASTVVCKGLVMTDESGETLSLETIAIKDSNIEVTMKLADGTSETKTYQIFERKTNNWNRKTTSIYASATGKAEDFSDEGIALPHLGKDSKNEFSSEISLNLEDETAYGYTTGCR